MATNIMLVRDVLLLIVERMDYKSTCALACTCTNLDDLCRDAWERKLRYRRWPVHSSNPREVYKKYASSGVPKVFSFSLKCMVPLHPTIRYEHVYRLSAVVHGGDVYIAVVSVCGSVYVANSEHCWEVDHGRRVRDVVLGVDGDLYMALLLDIDSGQLLEKYRVDNRERLTFMWANECYAESLLAMHGSELWFMLDDGGVRSTHSHLVSWRFPWQPYFPEDGVPHLCWKQYDGPLQHRLCSGVNGNPCSSHLCTREPTRVCCSSANRIHRMYGDNVVKYAYSRRGPVVLLRGSRRHRDPYIRHLYTSETKDICTYKDTSVVLDNNGTLSFMRPTSTRVVAKNVVWMSSARESSLLCFIVSRE
jgi:hypothetical protein